MVVQDYANIGFMSHGVLRRHNHTALACEAKRQYLLTLRRADLPLIDVFTRFLIDVINA